MAEAAPVTSRTRADKGRHLTALEAAIVSGVPVTTAVRDHAEKHRLPLKRARADLAQLVQRWARRVRAERNRRDANLAVACIRHESIYRRAVERDDLATALAAETSLCRLMGLYGADGDRTDEGGG